MQLGVLGGSHWGSVRIRPQQGNWEGCNGEPSCNGVAVQGGNGSQDTMGGLEGDQDAMGGSECNGGNGSITM